MRSFLIMHCSSFVCVCVQCGRGLRSASRGVRALLISGAPSQRRWQRQRQGELRAAITSVVTPFTCDFGAVVLFDGQNCVVKCILSNPTLTYFSPTIEPFENQMLLESESKTWVQDCNRTLTHTHN